MAQTKTNRKLIAVLLVMAMVLAISPVVALAASVTVTKSNSTTINSRNVTFGGTNVTFTGFSAPSIKTEGSNTVYETQVALSPNSTGTAVTVKIADGTTQTITLDSTTFTGTDDFTYSGDSDVIYRFNVYREAAYVAAPNGSVAYVTMPDAEITSFTAASGNDATTQTYTAVSSVAGFPKTLSLRLIPDGTSFDSLSEYSYEVTSSTGSVDYYAGTYYTIYFPTSGSTVTFTVTVGEDTTTYSITCSASASATTGDYIPYDFMPAPGQFANEGVGSGGWGDIYTTAVDSTTNKGVLKVNTTTGVTLGYFGGSVVIDFGTAGVDNNPKNPFGVDFILYGNAFWNNTEPACVQVAKAKADGTPDTWYDLAGSYYYTSNSTAGASIEYRNPQTEAESAAATTGTNVPYTLTTSTSTTGTVAANGFHHHSFFPTRANYITGYSTTFPAIAKQQDTIYKYELQSGETAKYKLTFDNSVLLNGVTSTSTVAGTFGYTDYYPVKTLGGNYAYNPYTTGTLANGNEFTTAMTNASYTAAGAAVDASGGDPMDISWAVDESGNPVYLDNIRFVRVYTGMARGNGIFGEVSSEFCGAAKATALNTAPGATGFASITASYGDSATSLDVVNTVKLLGVLKESTVTVPASVDSATISVTSSASNMLVKDTTVSSGSTSFNVSRTNGATQYFRIITQGTATNAAAQASVIVLKVVFQ